MKFGIVESTDRMGDRKALENLVAIANGNIEILSLSRRKGRLYDQIIDFVRDKDAILFVLLAENAALHFIAGIAVGLRKKIGFLCDASIYLPFSVRDFPYSIIHRSDDLELAVVSVTQKMLAGVEAQRMLSDLRGAGKQIIENRRVARAQRLPDHNVADASLSASRPETPREPTEGERVNAELHWTKKIAEKLSASSHISARANLDSEQRAAFDLVLWNSDPDNSIGLFENPIAVEVKVARKLASRTVTHVLDTAHRQNIRSLIIATTAKVPPSEKRQYFKKARSKGITLGIVDAIDRAGLESGDDFLSQLSIEGSDG